MTIDDPELMKELKTHASELKAAHAERDTMFEKYEEMYLLDWRAKANRKLKHMQVTASPDFRNQVQGAVRLMVATDPQINVRQTAKAEGVNVEKVEEFLNSTLYHSGRMAGEPVHYPLITAGILYDELHAAITPTADMLEYAKKAETSARTERDRLYVRANIERWEEIADATAFMVEPWNPRTGYPEWGATGLTAYYRVVETTVGEVADRFGELPDSIAGAPRSRVINLHTFYDAVYTAVWVDAGDLLCKPHGLPRLPVVAQILNGSRIFPDPEDQRQPIGYTLLKSNLWNAQNLALTAIFTAVLNQAWTPTKVYTPANEGSQIDVDADQDLIQLHPGDRLDFVQSKGLIDPGMREAYSLAQSKGHESGIYPQALGAPVESDATYSEVALLQQSGRLPLIGPQRRGGWGISDICETVIAYMRADPRYRAGTGLDATDTPRGLEIVTKLDVSLPQDKLQQSNILNILTDGENPKVPLSWALENILNINDPEEMRRQIWNERTTEQMYRLRVGQLLQRFAQQQEQGPQAGPPGQPPNGGPPQGPPQGPPMTSGPQMSPEQAQMMEGGLPPQQAGIMPGPGRIMQPPPDRVRP
jgi:hypothetical protein